MKKAFWAAFAAFSVLGVGAAEAQTSYTWATGAGGDYTLPANWSPVRTTPATNDILTFDGSITAGLLTVTNLNTESIGELHVINSGKLRFQAATAAKVLTIAGGASTKDLEVSAGSALELNGSIAELIAVSATANGDISGDIIYTATAAVAMQLKSGQVDGIIFESGSTCSMAPTGSGGGGGFVAGVANGVRFKSGSEFHHGGLKDGTYNGGTGANPFVSSQPASLVVFDAGSNYYFEEGIPSISGRTYGNFIWRTGINQTVSGGTGAFTVQGDLIFRQAPAGKATQGLLSMSAQTGAVSATRLIVETGSGGFSDAGATANTGNFTIKGDVDIQSSSLFTPATNATRVYILGGTSAQSVNFAGKALSTLTVNNSAGITLAGNVSVTGVTTMTAGNITTGANTLTLNGALTRTAGQVNGNMAYGVALSTTPSLLFPVGTTGVYAPVTINLTGASTTTGSILVASTAAVSPLKPSGGVKGLNRYWTITPTTLTGYTADVTFTYLASELDAGATESALQAFRHNGTNFVLQGGSVNTTTKVVTATGVTAFSPWTLFDTTTSVGDWKSINE